MARGANTQPQEYILEGDRALPVEEQTIWDIRCKNTIMGNATLSRYTRAQSPTANGGSEYDVRKLQAADKEDFLEFCVGVTNYGWSPAYLEAHPQIEVHEIGFYTGKISDPEEMADLVEDMSVGDFNELAAAANNQVKLSRGAKKNQNFSSGFRYGNQKKPA